MALNYTKLYWLERAEIWLQIFSEILSSLPAVASRRKLFFRETIFLTRNSRLRDQKPTFKTNANISI